jgi:prepilin signal peptidase PulO-like enzyme (type II secretory pathway)
MLDRLPIAVLAGIVGWCLGWASASLTTWLESGLEHGQDCDPEPEAAEKKVLAHGAWLPDPLVQGASALVWVLAGDWWRWAGAGLLAVPYIQVAVTDFRTRYVYTVIAAIGLAIGLAVSWQVHGGQWWTSVAGAIGGFAFLGFFYLLGKLYVRVRHLENVEAMASGDITIAAMVGAGSAACTLSALFDGMIMGGLLALGVWVVRRSARGTMPFGPGLCLGGLATLFWC